MAKDKKLRGTFQMKESGAKKSKRYKFSLKWEDRILYYKDFIWKRIYLSETVGWDVDGVKPSVSKGTSQQGDDKRIISLKVWSKRRKKAVTRKLLVPTTNFNDWLYWLLVSIQKHSNIPITDEKLEGVALNTGRKGKIRARRDMKSFDTLHRAFITSIERIEKGEQLSSGFKITPSRFEGPEGEDQRRRQQRLGIKSDRRARAKWTGEAGVWLSGFGKKVGEGGQGSIRLVNQQKPTGIIQPAVVKSATVNEPNAKSLIKEARILAALGEHPNIIREIDARATNRSVYLVLEKGEQDLKKFVQQRMHAGKKLTPIQINIIALGMLAGLSHMHQRKIYHFDFKPDNVMMFEGYRPKIIDFGLGRTKLLYPGDKIYGYEYGSGTEGYIAPEGYGNFKEKMKSDDFFWNATQMEKFDSFSAGQTILRALIGPRYGWMEVTTTKFRVPLKLSSLATPVGCASEESKYWNKVCLDSKNKENRKLLDRDGLLILSHLAVMLIQWDRRQRITVQEAYEALKNACKERPSGRTALAAQKKWTA